MTKSDANNALTRYWQLVVVLLGGAVAWGSLNADVDELKKKSVKSEEKVATLVRQDSEIKQKLVEIEINQNHLKEDVADANKLAKENSDKLDEILRKLD